MSDDELARAYARIDELAGECLKLRQRLDEREKRIVEQQAYCDAHTDTQRKLDNERDRVTQLTLAYNDIVTRAERAERGVAELVEEMLALRERADKAETELARRKVLR